MGQAREIMDKLNEAMIADDFDALERLYARDVVADTPDLGRLQGRDALLDWLRTFSQAFSDTTFEVTSIVETGDTAVAEGTIRGTHTGSLSGPEGEIPPTGKRVKVRECDVITIRDGVVVSHRFYFDQLELMGQLGLLQPETIVLPDAQPVSMSSGAGAH